MKQFLILFFVAVYIVTVNASPKGPKHHNWFLPHFKEQNQGSFVGLQGMKPEETTQYVVAQIGPGLVTDMTIFASCTGSPIRFHEKEIVSGFKCKNETSYACYKVCQFQNLGYINEKDMTIETEKMENGIFSTMIKRQNKDMDSLEDCVKGKTFKHDGKCMSMKNAMQCVWDSYYKNCEPTSEFNKNKRIVGDTFWSKDEE